jgi:hypothetical protein
MWLIFFFKLPEKILEAAAFRVPEMLPQAKSALHYQLALTRSAWNG